MKVEVQNLSKHFKEGLDSLVVIDQLNYSFPAGKKIAILGESGIGKSTLLHILAGIDLASSGVVMFGDTDIIALSDEERARFRGRDIGFIFQFHHLLNDFNAIENVAMPLLIRGEDQKIAFAKADSILSMVGLSGRATHRPGELSGGEQQRVAIARAVIIEPKVLLADEPTGNLDVKTSRVIHELVKEVTDHLKSTLIVATHSRELAAKMDLILEMQVGGKLTEVTLS